MKRVLILVLAVTMLSSYVAFCCDNCTSDESVTYISDNTCYASSDRAWTDGRVSICGTGGFEESNFGVGLFKVDLDKMRSNMVKNKYINKAEIAIYIYNSDDSKALYVAACEADFDWSNHTTIGKYMPTDKNTYIPIGDIICSDDDCTHKMPDASNTSDFCSGITKMTAGGYYYMDITNYILDKLNSGDSVATIGIKSVYQEDPKKYMVIRGASWGTTTHPYVKLTYRDAYDDAYLKNVKIENKDNVILDKLFDKNVFEYNLCLKDETLGIPDIEGVLNNKYASIDVKKATAVGESTVLTVTAEDKITTLKYTFNYKTMDEMGISPDGKLTLERLSVTDGTDNIKELPYGNEVKSIANVKNKNINIKYVGLISSVTEDSVLTDLKADIKPIYAGDLEYVTSMQIPEKENNPSLEVFVIDTENIVPLGDAFILPKRESNFTKNDEFTVVAKDLNSKVLTISGKLPVKDANVLVSVFEYDKKDYILNIKDKTESDILNNIQYITLVKTDKDGYYSTEISVKGNSGKYAVNFNGEGIKTFEEFNYKTTEDRKSLITELYQNNDFSFITDKTSNVGEELGLDLSLLKALTPANVQVIMGKLAEKEDKVNIDFDGFYNLYEKAVNIEMLNSGLVEDVSQFSENFSLTEDALYFYNKLPGTIKKDFSTKTMSGKGFTLENEISESFTKEIIIPTVNNVGNINTVIELIDKFHGIIGLSEQEYNDYNSLGKEGKPEHAIELLKKSGNNTLAGLKDNIVNVTDAIILKNTVIILPPPVTTGGGGGGGRVTASAEITGQVETEVPTLDTVASKTPFLDITSYEWAYDAIENLYNEGVINGTSATTFAPESQVKREEFIKMIDTLYTGDNANVNFSDVSSDKWYAPYISKAVNAGIIKGMNEDTFGIGNGVTREDMAVILYRILKGEKSEESDKFADDSNISDYAKDAVYYLKSKGIISGTGEGSFEPKRVMTRAEAAVVINNILSLK